MADKEKETAPKAKVEAAEESRFVVDGKAVSEEAYFKAAEAAGWHPATMREQNSYPAIGTKRHGE